MLILKDVAFPDAQYPEGVQLLMLQNPEGVQLLMLPNSEGVQFMMHPKSEGVQFVMHLVVHQDRVSSKIAL